MHALCYRYYYGTALKLIHRYEFQTVVPGKIGLENECYTEAIYCAALNNNLTLALICFCIEFNVAFLSSRFMLPVSLL